MDLRWLPNTLTISRLLLAGAFPFVPVELRFTAVAYGLATEFLDGFLARRLDATSRFGELLDPIADKAFVFAVLGTMFFAGETTWQDLLLVGMRDVVIGSLSLILLVRRDLMRHVKARFAGKSTTALQFLFLVWLVAAGTPPRALVYGTALVSIIALMDQARAWGKALTEPDSEG